MMDEQITLTFVKVSFRKSIIDQQTQTYIHE